MILLKMTQLLTPIEFLQHVYEWSCKSSSSLSSSLLQSGNDDYDDFTNLYLPSIHPVIQIIRNEWHFAPIDSCYTMQLTPQMENFSSKFSFRPQWLRSQSHWEDADGDHLDPCRRCQSCWGRDKGFPSQWGFWLYRPVRRRWSRDPLHKSWTSWQLW